jgi:MFS family permease
MGTVVASRSVPAAGWKPLLAGMLALAVAMGVGRFAFTPILPSMRNAFGLSPSDLGALAAANYLGYLLGAIAATSPRLGRWQEPILRGSLLLVVVFTGLMATTHAPLAWLALRLLAGVASAGVFVYGSAAVLGWLARHGRAALAGWFFSGVGVGIAAAGLVVLVVQRLRIGGEATWRAEWLGVTLLAVALIGPCWAWLPREPVAGRARLRPAGGGRRWPSTALLLLGAAYFLDGVGYIVAGTFLVAIAGAVPGLAGWGAAAWILVGMAGAPSAVLWIRAGARFGQMPALTLAYLLQGVSLALPALSDRADAAALSAILFGGTFIGITALTVAEGRRLVPPERAASTIGALTAVFGVGQVIGPLLAGALAGEQGDFRLPLLVASAVVFLGALLVFAARSIIRPD